MNNIMKKTNEFVNTEETVVEDLDLMGIDLSGFTDDSETPLLNLDVPDNIDLDIDDLGLNLGSTLDNNTKVEDLDLIEDTKNNTERLKAIIDNNLTYYSYKSKRKNISTKKIVDGGMKGFITAISVVLDKYSDTLNSSEINDKKEAIGKSVSKLQEALIKQLDEELLNKPISGFNLRNMLNDISYISEKFSFDSQIFSTGNLNQVLRDTIVNIFANFDKQVALANESLSENERNIMSILGQEISVAEIEKIKLNVTNFNQKFTCPKCGKVHEHKVIECTNSVRNCSSHLYNSKRKFIAFAHIPIICECGSILLLNHEFEQNLNTSMAKQLEGDINDNWEDYSDRLDSDIMNSSIFRPSYATLKTFSNYIELDDSNLKESVERVTSLEHIIENRKQGFLNSSKDALKKSLSEICSGNYDKYKDKLSDLIDYNSVYLDSGVYNNYDYNEIIIRSFFSTTFFADLLNNRYIISKYLESNLLLQKDMHVIDELLGSVVTANTQLSKEVTVRIDYLNESLIRLPGFIELKRDIPSEQTKKLLKAYRDVLQKDYDIALARIEEHNKYINNSLDYFLNNSKEVAFSIKGLNKGHSVLDLALICGSDEVFKKVFTTMISSYSYSKWTSILLQRSVNLNNSNLKEIEASKEHLVDYIAHDFNNNCYCLSEIKDALRRNHKFQVYYFLIYFYKEIIMKKLFKEEDSFCFLKESIKKFGMTLEDDSKLYESAKNYGSKYFEKLMYLKCAGFSVDEILKVSENNGAIEKWKCLGRTRSSNEDILDFLNDESNYINNCNFEYNEEMLEVLNILKIMCDLKDVKNEKFATRNLNREKVAKLLTSASLQFNYDKKSLINFCKQFRPKKEPIYISKIQNDLTEGLDLLNVLYNSRSSTDFKEDLSSSIVGSKSQEETNSMETIKYYYIMEQGTDNVLKNEKMVVASVESLLAVNCDKVSLEKISSIAPKIYVKALQCFYKCFSKSTWESEISKEIFKWNPSCLNSYVSEFHSIMSEIKKLDILKYTHLSVLFKNATYLGEDNIEGNN